MYSNWLWFVIIFCQRKQSLDKLVGWAD